MQFLSIISHIFTVIVCCSYFTMLIGIFLSVQVPIPTAFLLICESASRERTRTKKIKKQGLELIGRNDGLLNVVLKYKVLLFQQTSSLVKPGPKEITGHISSEFLSEQLRFKNKIPHKFINVSRSIPEY